MTDNKDSLDDILSRIDNMFKVIDIANEIVTADNLEKAKNIHKTENFDRVPIKKGNTDNIEEYYDSNKDKIIEIKPDNLISESFRILETLNYFCLSRKDFYFVLKGNRITHIVHYLDLNNPIVLSEIYTYISYCEEKIRDYLKCKNNYGNTDDEIEKFLQYMKTKTPCLKDNIENAIDRFERKKKRNKETNVLDELYFYDELILFRDIISTSNNHKFKEYINLNDDTIKSYNNLRNHIMHSKKQIIKKHSDIKNWADFLKACQNIINFIDRNGVNDRN